MGHSLPRAGMIQSAGNMEKGGAASSRWRPCKHFTASMSKLQFGLVLVVLCVDRVTRSTDSFFCFFVRWKKARHRFVAVSSVRLRVRVRRDIPLR